MKLSDKEREKLFHQGKYLSSTLGSLFQNEMDLNKDMVDKEFMTVEALKFEIELYQDQLQKLKGRL